MKKFKNISGSNPKSLKLDGVETWRTPTNKAILGVGLLVKNEITVPCIFPCNHCSNQRCIPGSISIPWPTCSHIQSSSQIRYLGGVEAVVVGVREMWEMAGVSWTEGRWGGREVQWCAWSLALNGLEVGHLHAVVPPSKSLQGGWPPPGQLLPPSFPICQTPHRDSSYPHDLCSVRESHSR